MSLDAVGDNGEGCATKWWEAAGFLGRDKGQETSLLVTLDKEEVLSLDKSSPEKVPKKFRLKRGETKGMVVFKRKKIILILNEQI